MTKVNLTDIIPSQELELDPFAGFHGNMLERS